MSGAPVFSKVEADLARYNLVFAGTVMVLKESGGNVGLIIFPFTTRLTFSGRAKTF